MNESSVIKIIDAQAKTGISAKTGKPWSMSTVELKNGETAYIFNPIDVGDVVEKVKNGEFENWQKKKYDPKHDEIMKKLDEILNAITGGVTVEPVDEPLPPLPEDY